mgnify:CR=1 FL=1
MKWGSVKTLFIVAFLVLNVFLLLQFLEKIDETNMETLSQTTLEEQLEAENITIGELPESGINAAYVSAERYQFTPDDIEELENSLENQNIVLDSESEIIVSEFIEPVPLAFGDSPTTSLQTLSEYIIYDEVYELWTHDEENNVLLFFQKQNDRTILFNEAGVLLVKLNHNQEAVSYYQTILDEVRVQGEEQTVVDPMNAVESLFNSNELQSEDHLSNMELAYHALVPLDDGEQVFTPTWTMQVNEGERYAFVNAMEGQVILTDEEAYVSEIETHMEQLIEENIRSETE